MTDSAFKTFMNGLIFLLSFIFFLGLLKANTSWITLIVIFVAIFLLTFIVFSGSVSKKLSIATVISVLFLVLAIFSGLVETDLGEVNDPRYVFDPIENFNNDTVESFRGYDIEGNYTEKNNALHIVGTCVITRNTSAKQPWIAFDASGGGLVNVDILDNNLPDYGYDNFKSGQVVITKDKRNYYFKVKGDFYYFYINNNFAESFGIAEGGREGRERTYRLTITSKTSEGVLIDNIESK